MEKVRRNNADFSTIEITSKKVRGNNVEFSTSEITPIKLRVNNVDFSTIEITSKKYTEMTWKFVKIWSSTYRRNIHVESTLIRRDAPIGMLLFFNFYFLPFLSNKIRVIITIFQLINSYVKVLHGNTLKNRDTSFFNIFLL